MNKKEINTPNSYFYKKEEESVLLKEIISVDTRYTPLNVNNSEYR